MRESLDVSFINFRKSIQNRNWPIIFYSVSTLVLVNGSDLAAPGKEEFCRSVFIILQRWLSIMFANNMTNLGEILSGSVDFFIVTDLKVVSATFLLVYFMCLKESNCETRKNVFNFTSKALFVLEITKFLLFRYSNVMTSSNA